MLKRLYTIILLCALVCPICRAWQARYFEQDRLSCSLIKQITGTSDGFLWIATENGLNKFDGWSFRTYFNDRKDTTSLVSSYIESLLEADGTLWVGSSCGLQRYVPYEDCFRVVSFPNRLTPSVLHIAQMRDGALWCVTAGYGTFEVNPQAMTAKPLGKVNRMVGTSFVHNLFQDSKRRIWIAADNGRIVCLDKSQNRLFSALVGKKQDHFHTILEDKRGNVLFAATSGVYQYMGSGKFRLLPVEGAEQGGIRGMTLSKSGMVYVATMNSSLRYADLQAGLLRRVNMWQYVRPDNILAIWEGNGERFFLGYAKSGLAMHTKQREMFFFKHNAALTSSFNKMQCLALMRSGTALTSFGFHTLLALDYSLAKKREYHLPYDVQCALEESPQTVLLGCFGGVLRLNLTTGNVEELPQFHGKTIKTMRHLPDGRLIVAVPGEGFSVLDERTGKIFTVSEKTLDRNRRHLKNNWINAILPLPDGKVWLGHCMGVDLYDLKKREFLALEGIDDLRTSVIYAIEKDNLANVWFATHDGLFRYNPAKALLTPLRISEGLPSNVICSLAMSRSGDLWGSTYNGLFSVNLKTCKVTCYLSSNGLKDREYLLSMGTQQVSDRILVGSLNGITGFFPDRKTRQKPLSVPQLTHFFINNQEVSASLKASMSHISDSVWQHTSRVVLSHKVSDFALEFSLMDFSDKRNTRFLYRLLGRDKQWRSTDLGENRISFSYLPSGTYTLEVKAEQNGVTSPVKTITLRITPPWWLSWWAETLWCLLAIAALYFAFLVWQRWQRGRQQEMINEEKVKFFVDIAHDLRSPITLIISPLTSLLQREKEPQDRRALLTIQRNASRVVKLINQLLDLRRLEKGQLLIACQETEMVAFIEDLLQMFDYQARKRNIRLSFEHKDTELRLFVDRDNFDKVLLNLISNAFKYTPDGGEITVRLERKQGKIDPPEMKHRPSAASLLTFQKRKTDLSQTGGNQHVSVDNPQSSIDNPQAANGISEASQSISLTGGEYAEISVSDTGIGLDEEKLERIFERFYQNSSSAKGYGIGLNLTRMLVEKHHGRILALNRQDRQGSRFSVLLPLGKEHLQKSEILSLKDQPRERAALQEKIFWAEAEDAPKEHIKSRTSQHVLVVDDDEEMREYLSLELSPYYKVYVACNGEEAYKLALKKQVDLIISDVMMPSVNGWELLKLVKSNANISHIPFLLLTSKNDPDDRIRSWGVGADGFLGKPFEIEELLVLAKNLLLQRQNLKGKYLVDDQVEEHIEPLEVKANDECFMEKVIEAVNKNIGEAKFSVEDLASQVGVSRVQLHRKLKALTGLTTTEFIRNIRLKQAAKLLKEQKVNVSQIAYIVGFSNPTMFSVAFKKFYGCTPSEYIHQR